MLHTTPHGHEQPLGTHTLPDKAHLRVHDIVYQVLCLIHASIESERDHLL